MCLSFFSAFFLSFFAFYEPFFLSFFEYLSFFLSLVCLFNLHPFLSFVCLFNLHPFLSFFLSFYTDSSDSNQGHIIVGHFILYVSTNWILINKWPASFQPLLLLFRDLRVFFTTTLNGGRWLAFPRVTRTLLSILIDFCYVLDWIVSILCLIYNSSNLFF